MHGSADEVPATQGRGQATTRFHPTARWAIDAWQGDFKEIPQSCAKPPHLAQNWPSQWAEPYHREHRTQNRCIKTSLYGDFSEEVGHQNNDLCEANTRQEEPNKVAISTRRIITLRLTLLTLTHSPCLCLVLLSLVTHCFSFPSDSLRRDAHSDTNALKSRDRRQAPAPQLSCGGVSYNPAAEMCCHGNVEPRVGASPMCCESSSYDPSTQMCCEGTVSNKPPGIAMCCGSEAYDANSQICCNGNINTKATGPKAQPGCCGEFSYDAASQLCCDSHPVLMVGSLPSCCGRNGYDANTSLCCGDNNVAFVSGPQAACCGDMGYSRNTHLCCDSNVLPMPAMGACCGSWTYSQQTHLCCEGRQLYKGMNTACCGAVGYNQVNSLCCEGTVVPKSPSKPVCCGTTSYNPLTELCCDGVAFFKTGFIRPTCCGGAIYDATVARCCDGVPTYNVASCAGLA